MLKLSNLILVLKLIIKYSVISGFTFRHLLKTEKKFYIKSFKLQNKL